MGLLFNFSKAEGVVLLFKLSIQHKITYGPTNWCRSKLYLPRRHHFSLLSGSCSYHQSDEANRYIISVAGPFKLIFQNWDEIRKTFDKGTGHKWTIPFIFTFNKLFNKARALTGLVVHLVTFLVVTSLIDCYYKLVLFLNKCKFFRAKWPFEVT